MGRRLPCTLAEWRGGKCSGNIRGRSDGVTLTDETQRKLTEAGIPYNPEFTTAHSVCKREAMRAANAILADKENTDPNPIDLSPPGSPVAAVCPNLGSLLQPGGRVNLSSHARHDQLSKSALQKCLTAATITRKSDHRHLKSAERQIQRLKEEVKSLKVENLQLRKQLQGARVQSAEDLLAEARLSKVRSLADVMRAHMSGLTHFVPIITCKNAEGIALYSSSFVLCTCTLICL